MRYVQHSPFLRHVETFALLNRATPTHAQETKTRKDKDNKETRNTLAATHAITSSPCEASRPTNVNTRLENTERTKLKMK
jgi:hypothetical protein